MTDRTIIARAVAAAIQALHEQAAVSGCATSDNGTLVQVDGSFDIEPVVRAVLRAAAEMN